MISELVVQCCLNLSIFRSCFFLLSAISSLLSSQIALVLVYYVYTCFTFTCMCKHFKLASLYPENMSIFWVLGIGFVFLLWHSLSLPYNHFSIDSRLREICFAPYFCSCKNSCCGSYVRCKFDTYKSHTSHIKSHVFQKFISDIY